MSKGRTVWSNVLPVVLLGLRTTYRDELEATVSELVYGSTEQVSGQFLEHCENFVPQSDFVKGLRTHFKELRPVTATRHSTDKVFVSKKLRDCTHVFLRTDALRRAHYSHRIRLHIWYIVAQKNTST